MMVLCRGSRCWTTTTGTGNPAGRPPSTRPSAVMPPADAAMATMPYGSPGSARGDCGSLIGAHRPGDAHAHGKRSGPSNPLHLGGLGASVTALIALQAVG